MMLAALILAGTGASFVLKSSGKEDQTATEPMNEKIKLPKPKHTGSVSVEQALLERRSVREYNNESLTLDEVSQLLWAAQGISDPNGFYRTAPSAGALYPLEVYIVTGRLEGVQVGVYKYLPHQHTLTTVFEGDVRKELTKAALGQYCVKDAAVVIVISAVYERTTGKYGDRGIRYVHMEAGHAAENIFLQAVALDLGMVTVGAFYDEDVEEVLDMPANERALYILPVGKI